MANNDTMTLLSSSNQVSLHPKRLSTSPEDCVGVGHTWQGHLLTACAALDYIFLSMGVEKDIHSIRWAYTANRRGRAEGSSHSKTVINTPSKRKSTSEVVTRTSKRYKPGD